ncbi:MAG TPA: hypothetical protein VJT73_16655, partial [Polyangiaceae bacterium]|nr:hypothetical protein [Polyangiaceae bacterium]
DAYVRATMTLLRRTGAELSFLLHPLDFLGHDMVRGLEFFPGMKKRTTWKLALFDAVMSEIRESFLPITMREHARVLLDNGQLKRVSLS